MDLTYKIEGGNVLFYGTKLRRDNGAVVAGCYVVLCNYGDGSIVGRTTTNERGEYRFSLGVDVVPSGKFIARFYGSGVIENLPPEGDWEILTVVSENTEALVLNDDLVVGISEGSAIVDVNKSQFAVGILSITNISILSGVLSEVEVYAKLSSEADYVFVQSVPTKIVANAISQKFVFSLRSKTVGFDFMLRMKSGGGVIGKLENGDDAVFMFTNVTINGVDDLAELYEVRDLEIINATNGESGIVYSTFAELRWEDIRNVAQGYFPIITRDGYSGADQMLTFEQAQMVKSFEVYMYVTQSSTPPAHQYPGSGGSWFYIGSFETPNAVVRCPKNSKVAFWVGMKTGSTVSSIVKNNIQY